MSGDFYWYNINVSNKLGENQHLYECNIHGQWYYPQKRDAFLFTF